MADWHMPEIGGLFPAHSGMIPDYITRIVFPNFWKLLPELQKTLYSMFFIVQLIKNKHISLCIICGWSFNKWANI